MSHELSFSLSSGCGRRVGGEQHTPVAGTIDLRSKRAELGVSDPGYRAEAVLADNGKPANLKIEFIYIKKKKNSYGKEIENNKDTLMERSPPLNF